MKKYAYTLALLVLFSGCSALQEKQEPSSVSAVSSLVSSTAPDESSSESVQEETQVTRAQLRSTIMNTSAGISKMDQIVTDDSSGANHSDSTGSCPRGGANSTSGIAELCRANISSSRTAACCAGDACNTVAVSSGRKLCTRKRYGACPAGRYTVGGYH